MEVPFNLIRIGKHPTFVTLVERDEKFGSSHRETTEVDLNLGTLSTEAMEELAGIAEDNGQPSLGRTLRAIISGRQGDFSKVIPKWQAAEQVFSEFFKQGKIDGWAYIRQSDDRLMPYLVQKIWVTEGRRGEDPTLSIRFCAYGIASRGVGFTTETVSFSPSDLTKKRAADALEANGVYKETAALKANYLEEMARLDEMTRGRFAEQFTFAGTYLRSAENYYDRGSKPEHKRKVIHDLRDDDYSGFPAGADTFLAEEPLPVPEHPVVRVYDLSSHQLMWTNAAFLTPYVYDKSLRDKLILPDSHRDLLDVMTTDLDAFLGDIIEGKSAGNIILCKGIPGVGKTLTAEIYSEIIEKPLYSIHSGALGTTAESIARGLKTIFGHQKRWGCVLLLDEADVFVVQRGGNIEQNAIVAEFLRVLEYFDGLLFMTTNRPDDIDEAIISRCAAVIGYDVPNELNRMKVWQVLLVNYGVEAIRPSLLSDLVDVFPTITPRDTKMLLRLALRVAKFHNEELSIDIFRRCAMFRAIEVKDVVTEADAEKLV